MRFRILGPIEVFDGKSWRGIGAEKWRVLLALLLIDAGRIVSVDRIAAELWRGRPPATFRNVIHGYVARLRDLLDDRHRTLLVTRHPGYQLVVDAGDVDADLFAVLVEQGRAAWRGGDLRRASARLGEALAVWHGPALADVPSTPTVQAETARLEEQRLAAIETRVEVDLACGRHAGLIPELRVLAGDHPFREPLWRQLILAQYRSGRRAEALATCRSVRRRLADEIGIDPGRDLQRLEVAILRNSVDGDSTVGQPGRS